VCERCVQQHRAAFGDTAAASGICLPAAACVVCTPTSVARIQGFGPAAVCVVVLGGAAARKLAQAARREGACAVAHVFSGLWQQLGECTRCHVTPLVVSLGVCWSLVGSACARKVVCCLLSATGMLAESFEWWCANTSFDQPRICCCCSVAAQRG
jgi:hypothetical protein